MNLFRDLRLIPVVAIAAAALFALKVTSLVMEGGYTLIASRAAMAQGGGTNVSPSDMTPPAPLEEARPAAAAVPTPSTRGDRQPEERRVQTESWVRDLYEASNGANAASAANNGDITGSVAAAPKSEAPAEAPKESGGHGGGHGAAPAPDKNISTTPPEPIKPQVSAGERAVLESLQQRRQELDTRAREMEVRESLMKATEKRIEQRLQELKDMESRVSGAEKKKEEDEASKFKSLVSMYENMKPKDAAKIFDRLNMQILVEVVNAMNPRKMSDILGQMQPEVAEKLTVEIANRSGAIGKAAVPADLPKIEGRPKT